MNNMKTRYNKEIFFIRIILKGMDCKNRKKIAEMGFNRVVFAL